MDVGRARALAEALSGKEEDVLPRLRTACDHFPPVGVFDVVVAHLADGRTVRRAALRASGVAQLTEENRGDEIESGVEIGWVSRTLVMKKGKDRDSGRQEEEIGAGLRSE